MLDFRRRYALVAFVIGCLVLSGCGVAANSTAATVEGHDISIERVLKYIHNEDAASSLGLPLAQITPDSAPGEVIQSVLGIEIQRTALIAALEGWGLSIDDATRAEAAEQFAQSGQDFADDELNAGFVEYYAAFDVLAQKFMSLDVSNTADMRTLYEGMADEWDQICASILGAEEFEIPTVSESVEDGASLLEVSQAHEGSQSVVMILDGAQECLPRYAFPPDLVESMADTPVGEIGHIISQEMMGTIVYFHEVHSFNVLSFEDALPQLEELVTQWNTDPEAAMTGVNRWAGYLASNATVNPQFGSGVVFGQTLTVQPPVRPAVQQRQPVLDVEPQELLIEE